MKRTAEATPSPEATCCRIDDLIIDVGRHRVTRGDREVSLPALSFDLLLALARAAPNMLTYDQLMKQVWPGVVVNQETVTQRVKLVRDALGDDPQIPRYIGGVRGRGYRVIAPVVGLADGDSSAQVEATPPRRWKRWLFSGVAAAVIITTAVLAITQWRTRDSTSVIVRAPPHTIAILPFVNLSGEAKNEYFGDGLTEELINRVGKIPQLRVTARTSAFAHKGSKEDVRAIGNKLGVTTILEGGVRRSGDQVRVTAQLIDVRNGYQLWSDSYERDVRNIFWIHEEIANRIAQAVGIRVAQAAPRKPPSDPGAYDLYLRGRTSFAQRNSESDVRQAISYFEQALALDPSFADAMAWLATALTVLPGWSTEPYLPTKARAEAYARQALALDPSLPNAHVVVAAYAFSVKHDFLAAEEAFRMAIRTGPSSVGAYHYYGDFLQTMGRVKEGYTWLMQARQLDPADAPINWLIGLLEIHLGYLDEAEGTLKVVSQLGVPDASFLRGYLALRRGDLARAHREYDEFGRVFGHPSYADEIFTERIDPGPGRPKPPEFVRDVRRRCANPEKDIFCYERFVSIEDYEAAFATARKWFAAQERDPLLEFVWWPDVKLARSQPGFKTLMRDLGLVAYWRKYGWADSCKPLGDTDFQCE